MVWLDPRKAPFRINGFAFYNTDKIYRRMPIHPRVKLPEAVDRLSDETAGGQIRFHGKVKKLALKVTLSSKPLYFEKIKSPHLSEAAKQSFDLYLSKDGKDFIFYDVSKNMTGEKSYVRNMIEFDAAQEFDFLLNFPTYGAVDEVLIGVDEEAEISESIYEFESDKKIVLYGTSIQQGASALRPGNSTSAILSRWINTEVYNMGFNSSGQAEKEVAQVLSDINDTAALVMSVEGNCPSSDWLSKNLKAFIETYRINQPETPVIIMPFMVTGLDFLTPQKLQRHEKNLDIQEKIVLERVKSGDKNIYLLSQESLIQRDFDGHSIWHELTVDGIHYTDMGFYATAAALYKFLKEQILH